MGLIEANAIIARMKKEATPLGSPDRDGADIEAEQRGREEIQDKAKHENRGLDVKGPSKTPKKRGR